MESVAGDLNISSFDMDSRNNVTQTGLENLLGDVDELANKVVTAEYSSRHNIWFGISGLCANSLSVVLILHSGSRLPQYQRMNVLSLTVNDIIFMMAVTIYGVIPLLPKSSAVEVLCSPITFITSATNIVSYATITNISFVSFLAAYRPISFSTICSSDKTALRIVGTWLVSWIFALSCYPLHVKTDTEGCSIFSITPGYGLIVWSCIGLTCSLLVVYFNVKIIKKLAPRDNKVRTLCYNQCVSNTTQRSSNEHNQACKIRNIPTPGKGPRENMKTFSRRNKLSISNQRAIQFSCNPEDAFERPNTLGAFLTRMSRRNDTDLTSHNFAMEIHNNKAGPSDINKRFATTRDQMTENEGHCYNQQRDNTFLHPNYALDGRNSFPRVSLVENSTISDCDALDKYHRKLDKDELILKAQAFGKNIQKSCPNSNDKSYMLNSSGAGPSNSFHINSIQMSDTATNIDEHGKISIPNSSTDTADHVVGGTPAGVTENEAHNTSEKQKNKSKRRAITTLVFLSLFCCLLMLPMALFILVLAIRLPDRQSIHNSRVGRICKLTAGLHALSTPVLYTWRLLPWDRYAPSFHNKIQRLRTFFSWQRS